MVAFIGFNLVDSGQQKQTVVEVDLNGDQLPDKIVQTKWIVKDLVRRETTDNQTYLAKSDLGTGQVIKENDVFSSLGVDRLQNGSVLFDYRVEFGKPGGGTLLLTTNLEKNEVDLNGLWTEDKSLGYAVGTNVFRVGDVVGFKDAVCEIHDFRMGVMSGKEFSVAGLQAFFSQGLTFLQMCFSENFFGADTLVSVNELVHGAQYSTEPNGRIIRYYDLLK